MQIALLEPFFSGSHETWAREYITHSQHHILSLTLPGRHWKWRMHGGAVSLAEAYLTANIRPDLILATDMLDLSVFLSLTRKITYNIPTVLYMHENQLTYPWSNTDPDPALKRDRHYGFINFTSALSADRILFNSTYHLRSFIDALPDYLKAFPDFALTQAPSQIALKSDVLPIGLNLTSFNTYQTYAIEGAPLLILWNHRWEQDKNPDTFFEVLFQLADESFDFQVVVLGESFGRIPSIFKIAQKKLKHRIVHMGFLNDRTEYIKWIWKADLIPVTSFQDFFGISLIEALYCNTFPLLPDRLSYPEHIPPAFRPKHLYKDAQELLEKLRYACTNRKEIRRFQTQEWVTKYDWEYMCPIYDEALLRISQNPSSI